VNVAPRIKQGLLPDLRHFDEVAACHDNRPAAG
jgi:hypothetical protein